MSFQGLIFLLKDSEFHLRNFMKFLKEQNMCLFPLKAISIFLPSMEIMLPQCSCESQATELSHKSQVTLSSQSPLE